MNEELNKKLLEFAGFKLFEKAHHADIWDYPDGTRWEGQPHFTESLDACFKWLVPKLFEQNIEVSLFTKKGELDACILTLNNERYMCSGKYEVSKTLYVDGETVALALCLAVEQLIDRGE